MDRGQESSFGDIEGRALSALVDELRGLNIHKKDNVAHSLVSKLSS